MKKIGVAVLLLVVGAVAIVVWAKAQQGFSAREDPSGIEMFAARTMRSLSMPAAAKALKNPVFIDDKRLAEARMHWADHCFTCHGNDGSGNTSIGRNLFPKAPDMRADVTQSKADGELFYIIENGVRLTGMPAWGADGNHTDESWALVGFIRHLPKLTPDEIKEMEAMNPKSAHEAMEEKEEDDFLKGDSSPPEKKP